MQLFVIRHALAEDADPGQLDAERALTKEGKKRLKQVVRGMKKLGWKFDRAISSPWKRARQTAELVGKKEPLLTDLLAQPPRSDLLSLLATSGPSVAIVGHEPWLSELVAWLAFGDTKFHDSIELKKAGVIVLEGQPIPGDMTIHALVPPSMLSKRA